MGHSLKAVPRFSGYLLGKINGAAAFQRPTAAGHLFHFLVEVIVDRQFLAQLDPAGTYIEDVVLDDPRR